MKLELKHIAPYLPYGLKMKFTSTNEVDKLSNEDIVILKQIDEGGICVNGYKTNNKSYKPILRPLSDLTKEIEVNGEKFVPIVELAKIHGIDFEIKTIKTEYGTIVCYSEISLHPTDNTPFSREFFELDLSDCCFDFGFEIFGENEFDICETSYFPIRNQLELFQKLFEWNFDVFGLIEQGLAIDINTL